MKLQSSLFIYILTFILESVRNHNQSQRIQLYARKHINYVDYNITGLLGYTLGMDTGPGLHRKNSLNYYRGYNL